MEDNQPLEFTGDDVDAAVANGLNQLGVGPNDVLVEVIEEPSRGVFGIGAKPARVRLKLMRSVNPSPPPTSTAIPPSTRTTAEADYDESEADDYDDDDYYGDDDDEEEGEEEEDFPGEDGQIGKEVLATLLENMGIKARIVVRQADSTRDDDTPPWLLDVSGRNVNVLIGRRGDTLSSLQYITRLIASRQLQRRANIIVDVGDYKSRRSDKLKKLAHRMADQAVERGQTISLEPMPPNERRIIHLELRGRDDVETESTGEGSARKVTIVPI